MAINKIPPLAIIAKEAGQHIKQMRADILAQGEGAVTRKGDGSPVTKADKEAHDIISKRLAEAFPAVPMIVPLLSEEGTEGERYEALQSSERFEVDPLDGTETYISQDAGRDGYSVNIGYVLNGVPVEGAMYFPEKSNGRGELYYTQDGKAYMQIGDDVPKEIHVRKGALRNPLLVAVSYKHHSVDYLGGREVQLRKDAGQYRTCLVARGEYDVTGVNEGFSTYDIAAAHAILRAAGGDIVVYAPEHPLHKKPFCYTSTTSTDVPLHVAGSNDALVALHLASRQDVGAGRWVG